MNIESGYYLLTHTKSCAARLSYAVAASVIVLFAVACSSSVEKPTALLSMTENRIAVAESHDAREYAPLALKNAEDNYSQAKAAIDEGNYQKAQRHLEVAVNEADYAVAKSQAEQSEKAANELSQSLMKLQRETLQ